LDDESIELSFGVVNEPSAVMGLVATVGADTAWVAGLCELGGGLLPSVMFKRRVREAEVDEDDDRDETLRGCFPNISESGKGYKVSALDASSVVVLCRGSERV
jgi:hypothetical protein